MRMLVVMLAGLALVACARNDFAVKTAPPPDSQVIAKEDFLAYTLKREQSCPKPLLGLASEDEEEMDQMLEAIAERVDSATGLDAYSGGNVLGHIIDLKNLFRAADNNREEVRITATRLCLDEGGTKKVRTTTTFERLGAGAGIRVVELKWPEEGFPTWEARAR